MSRSNQYKLIAVIGLALLAASGQAKEREKEAERTADEQQEGAESFSIPVRIVESPIAAKARQRAQDEAAKREEKDLVAQQGMNSATQLMAKYALAQTLLILIGTGALIWTLLLTRKANEAAWAAVMITREIGQAQTRAYISAVSAKYTGSVRDLLSIKLVLKNFGNSPCMGGRLKSTYDIAIMDEDGADGGCRFADIELDGSIHILPAISAGAEKEFEITLNASSLRDTAEQFPFADDIFRVRVSINLWWFDVFDQTTQSTISIKEKSDSNVIGLDRSTIPLDVETRIPRRSRTNKSRRKPEKKD